MHDRLAVANDILTCDVNDIIRVRRETREGEHGPIIISHLCHSVARVKFFVAYDTVFHFKIPSVCHRPLHLDTVRVYGGHCIEAYFWSLCVIFFVLNEEKITVNISIKSNKFHQFHMEI